MWKFKWPRGRDKWLFLLTIGVILCILAFPAERLTKEEGKRADLENRESRDKEGAFPGETPAPEKEEEAWQVSARASDDYEKELERRVRELLKNVEGVGKVDVMIVLKSSGEKVMQIDESKSYSLTEEQDSSGGTRKVENQEQGHNTVLLSGTGENSPIIAKELRPELSGIIISAEGGGNPAIQAEISAAMEALFGLPPHKIKVLKRVE